MAHININIPIMKNKATKKSLTSKFPSNGLEKFLRIVGNVNGKRTEVETGMNLSCRSIGWNTKVIFHPRLELNVDVVHVDGGPSKLTGLVSRVLTVGCFCFVVSVVDSLNFICFEGGENISSEANNDKSFDRLDI